jgi:murein DD-endopeptidase MepM/ murein hydrolase activator NlpD
VAESLASRYIGSSDAIKMQQQATQDIGTATAQGFAKVTQANQQYLQGMVSNSQVNVQQSQQLAQIELARSNSPNSISQLAEGVVKGIYANKQEQAAKDAAQRKAAEEANKADRERRKTETLTKYTSALGNLTDSYESSNWDKGVDRFKSEAVGILSTLPDDIDPEVKLKLVQNIYDTSKARSVKVGGLLQDETEKVRNNQASVERNKLMANLTPILSSIATQSTDLQSEPYVKRAKEMIADFLTADNGIPRSDKLGIVADSIEALNANYTKKYTRWAEKSARVTDYATYAKKYRELDLLESVGEITPQERLDRQAVLNAGYPGFSELVTKKGDVEREQLSIQQLNNSQKKLRDEAGATAIANIRFTDESLRSMVAAAYSDPSFYSQLNDDPQLKDNPQFQQVIRGANELKEYFNESNKIVVQNAAAAIEFSKLDLSSITTITALTRQINSKTSNGVALTPTEQLAKAQLDLMIQSNPALAERLDLLTGKSGSGKLSPEQLVAISQSLQQEREAIVQIQKRIVSEAETRNTALQRSYPSLLNYGFIGQSQEAIREYAKRAAPSIKLEQERIDKARADAQALVAPNNYGIQPNFNPSSVYATSVDENGKIKVVPRAAAASITSGGKTLMVPLINGISAPVTGRWNEQRATHKHAGIDLGASMGSKTIALVPGVVVKVGTNSSGYGNFVDFLGDNGFLYRYAHAAANVVTGQRLKPGEVISTIDGSGRGTGAHLHFEVHNNPKFTDGKYDYSKNLGVQNTINPIEHLQQMQAKSSNVLTPRGNNSAYRGNPRLKAPGNSLLTSGGGAINGGNFQRQGGTVGTTKNRFGGQRPVTIGKAVSRVNAGSDDIDYDYNDNFGYAELEKDDGLRRAFVNAAKRLGVPPVWIVDIARQESGGIRPNFDHNGNHYGLFGFGNDSFSDKSLHTRLRNGEIDGAGQLDLYIKYMTDNGWDKLLKSRQGNVTIADVWAFTRMGWKMRHKFWETQDVNVGTNGGLTYADELRLLGKWAGRSYEMQSSRVTKNKAVSNKPSSTCRVCQQMRASGSFAPHVHN